MAAPAAVAARSEHRRGGLGSRQLALTAAAAWGVLVTAHVTGAAHLVDHDAILHDGTPSGPALGLFLAGWVVMVAAMMLPATLPFLDRRARTSPLAFASGFLLVWAAAGAAALAFDSAVHQTVQGVPAIEARPWLVLAALLVLAGGVQLAPSTGRHLARCCQLFPVQPDETSGAFAAGREQAVKCLRADGPLMLVMFATGGALGWMALLTAVMVGERRGRGGRHMAQATGVALLAGAAAVVLVH